MIIDTFAEGIRKANILKLKIVVTSITFLNYAQWSQRHVE